MTPLPFSGDATGSSYVYLLRSRKDNMFYLGWTTNLLRRLGEHNEGLNRSTKSRRPFKLVYFETYSSANEAKKRERTLKHNPVMYEYFKKRALLCSPALKAQKEVVG